MTDKQFTVEQLKCLEKARTIRQKLFEDWAREAAGLELQIVAQGYLESAHVVDNAIQTQQQSLKWETWGK